MSTQNSIGRELVAAISNVVQVISRFRKLFLAVLATTIAGLMLFPVVLILSVSMRESDAYFRDPVAIPSTLKLENYVEAWTAGGFQQYMLNSFIVVTVSLLLLLSVSLLAAYALIQFDFPAKKILLFYIIAGFMVPPEVLIAPLFAIVDYLGWINTYHAIILMYTAIGIPFAFFYIRQYLTTLPKTYAEAARMDGYSEWQILSRIYLPLSLPAITTIGVFHFVLYWNEFLYALIFLQDDGMRTAPAGLLAFSNAHTTDYTLEATGVVIAAIPAVIVFLLFRRHFIKGFTRGEL